VCGDSKVVVDARHATLKVMMSAEGGLVGAIEPEPTMVHWSSTHDIAHPRKLLQPATLFGTLTLQ
jgi:hypothetical protein